MNRKGNTTMETTNTNANVTENSFDPSEVRRAYSASQWAQKEEWYVSEANRLTLPPDPSPSDVQDIALGIDALMTTARLDYAYIHQNCERYSMQLKIEEKHLFVTLKQNPPAEFASGKLTVDDIKGVVAHVIKNNGWNGSKMSLYKLVEESSSRDVFLESIIKLLQDKKDLLITHNGILKLENAVGNMGAGGR